MEIILLVDALDEVFEEEGEKVAEQIIGFFHRLNNLGAEGRVKICFSSRHYPKVHVRTALQITVEDHNEEALGLFVKNELSEHVEGWDEENSEEERTGLVNLIVQRANRQFLWASIRVPMVAECLNSGSHSLGTVYRVLEGESDKLSDLYQKILAANLGVKMRSKTLALFQWIALSHRPITLAELRYAIASSEDAVGMEVNSCEEFEEFVESDERMEKLVKSLSGGLAMVSRDENGSVKSRSVRFIHKTVHDFVMFHGLALLFSVGERTSQRLMEGILESRIVRSCLNFLRSTKVLEAMESWERGDENDIVFIEYAAVQWPYQAGRSEFHGTSQVYVAELLGSKSRLGARTFEAWSRISVGLSRNQKDWLTSAYSASDLIHIATCWNLKSVVRTLLDSGTPVDVECWGRKTALYRAAKFGNEALVVMLLNAGAETSSKRHYPYIETPLEKATANSHSKVIQLILAEISYDTESLNIALHSAAKTCNPSLMSSLIGQGADVNSLDSDGKSPLQIVAARCHEPSIELLLAKGAAVNPRDSRHDSALQAVALWTAQWGSTDPERCERLARCLLDAGADIHFQGGETGNALQAALTNFSGEAPMFLVKYLLDKGADVNAKGGNSGTCLQAAAPSTEVELLRMLLDKGASIDEIGGEWGSALHAAARCGLGEHSALYLIDRGANIYIDSPLMGGILQSAAFGGSIALVSRLLSMGLDVNAQNGKYGNALHAAIFGDGGVSMVKLLLEHGADIDAAGEMYGSPLEAAISFGRHLIVRLLVERGADTHNVKEPRGDKRVLFWDNYPTPLLFATRYGWLQCVRELLDAGLDINVKGIWYGNAFSAAVDSGKISVVELLLNRGVNVDVEMIDECLKLIMLKKKMKQFLLELREGKA